MAFERIKFNYAYNSLTPSIDAKTMEIHSEKHHQGYTDKLNAALEGTEWENKPIEEVLSNLSSLPEDIQTTVRNNGGGFVNHNLFFSTLSPDGGGEPVGEIMDTIKSSFGSFEEFKQKFSEAAATVFGSGWAFLVKNSDGSLEIVKKPLQDSPLMDGLTPVMNLDVWEHAYYLNYQNKRADYIEAFWNVVDWAAVNVNFNE
jgi:Fe-Mn family superoxide dismutase